MVASPRSRYASAQAEFLRQRRVMRDQVAVEVGDERPVLALFGSLPEASPILIARTLHSDVGIGLTLVGDIARLQLVRGVEVLQGQRAEAVFAPDVLREVEVRCGL